MNGAAAPARAVLLALLALGCASHPAARRDQDARTGAPPACAPGTLLFSASQAPRALALSRDGTVVAVADRGALVLRDAATLAPIRYLVPALDHWQQVAFARDGRSVRAETVDGLRFQIDLATGKVGRLLNDERQSPREALVADEATFAGLFLDRSKEMRERERAFWQSPPPAAHFPSLPGGVEATGMAMGVLARVPGGRRLEPITELEAPDDADNARLYIAGSDGRIRAFDMDGKPVAEGALPPGAAVVRLAVGGDRVLAALADGGAAIYDRALALQRRVAVMERPNAPPPPDPAGTTDFIARNARGWPAHALVSLDYDPARGRLIWASTAHELGVLDVATGRALATLPGTASIGGVAQMAFLGPRARTIAAIAAGRLWVWDPYDGRRADRAARYAALAPLSETRILAAQIGGQGDVIDLDPGRFQLEVRRSLCLRADGDCSGRPRWDEIHNRLGRPPKLELAAAPDRRELALLEWPELDLTGSGRNRKGRLAILSADTFAVVRALAIDDCTDESPLRFGAREIAACGARHDRVTLAALPDPPEGGGGAWSKPGADPLLDFLGPGAQRVPVGAAAIGIARHRDGFDTIAVANARGELTGLLAREASRDESGRISDRAQLRTETMIEPSPDGSRFLIASRAIDGALQLWCTPTTDGIEGFADEPARPDVLEQDGITEIAVPDFPGWVSDAVETADGLLILGNEVQPPHASATPKQGLWTYDPATRKAARLELPAPTAGQAEAWERFDTDPGGTSMWLIGKHHGARREAGGGWSVFALPAGTTNQIAALDGTRAVRVGFRVCTGGKACLPGGVPSCFDVTLIGAVPASGAPPTRSFDTCVGTVAPFAGGFVALGGAEVGFRDGRWLDGRDPLVAAVSRAHASDGFGRDGELVLGVDRTRLEVLGLADGRPRRTIALPFAGRPSPVAASPVHGPSIWIAPDSGTGALVGVDAAGKVSIYGVAATPAWTVGWTMRPRGGRRALWWPGGVALVSLDGKRWSAVFNPLERAAHLVSRRVGY